MASGDGWWGKPGANVPSASIVIPTKDGGELLEKCVGSIFARTSGLPYGIVIVDNGSLAPGTRALLQRLAKDARVAVLLIPRPSISPRSAMLGRASDRRRSSFSE